MQWQDQARTKPVSNAELSHHVIMMLHWGREEYFFSIRLFHLAEMSLMSRERKIRNLRQDKMPATTTNHSGSENSLPNLCGDTASSGWGQPKVCEGPAVLHGKCKGEVLKSNFGTTWMGCLLNMVGEDTALDLDPTPACPAWEAWGDQHQGPFQGCSIDDDVTLFFSVSSFFLLAGRFWIDDRSQQSLCERQVSHSNKEGAKVLGKIQIR